MFTLPSAACSCFLVTLKPHPLNSFATLKRNSRRKREAVFPLGIDFLQLLLRR